MNAIKRLLKLYPNNTTNRITTKYCFSPLKISKSKHLFIKGNLVISKKFPAHGAGKQA
jgi:hypothetical protein